MLKQSEDDLQTAICKRLALEGWCCIQYAKPGTHRQLKGVLPDGHPDVIAFRKDRYVMMEVKLAGEILNEKQKLYHRYLQELGVSVRIVRSVEEALEVTG